MHDSHMVRDPLIHNCCDRAWCSKRRHKGVFNLFDLDRLGSPPKGADRLAPRLFCMSQGILCLPTIFELGPNDICCLVINSDTRSYCTTGIAGFLSVVPISLRQIPSAPCTRNAIPPHVADDNSERTAKNQDRTDNQIKQHGSTALAAIDKRPAKAV